MKAAQHMQNSGNRPSASQIQAIQKAMPPDLIRQIRAAGPANAQKVMQDYMAKNGESGFDQNAMMQAMMGGGGFPSMPGMPGESRSFTS